MSVIHEEIIIETLGATHHLPLPNEYERSYWLPSVVAFNAVGQPFVQVIDDVPLREWRLTCAIMTQAEMELAQSAWEGLSSQVCRYVDIFSAFNYSVTRHPDQQQLEAEAFKSAGNTYWRVSMRLLKTLDAYET